MRTTIEFQKVCYTAFPLGFILQPGLLRLDLGRRLNPNTGIPLTGRQHSRTRQKLVHGFQDIRSFSGLVNSMLEQLKVNKQYITSFDSICRVAANRSTIRKRSNLRLHNILRRTLTCPLCGLFDDSAAVWSSVRDRRK